MANSPAHDPSNILTKPKFSFKHTPNQQRSTFKKTKNKKQKKKTKKQKTKRNKYVYITACVLCIYPLLGFPLNSGSCFNPNQQPHHWYLFPSLSLSLVNA